MNWRDPYGTDKELDAELDRQLQEMAANPPFMGGGLGRGAARGLAKFFGRGGAKSLAEYAKHMAKLERARSELAALGEKLRNATSHWERKAIEARIRELKEAIKGHEKEIGQKWPNGPPSE